MPMISVEYCRLMARYNSWQNTALITAADQLTDAHRWRDRGAFFKSIAATFNHLYWADALMLARLNGNERPHETITHSLTSPSDWATFKDLRVARDGEVADWVAGISTKDLSGAVSWYPPRSSDRVTFPKALCVVQFFNHQTHHRGQIHAMLTATGAMPGPTDIPAMPAL